MNQGDQVAALWNEAGRGKRMQRPVGFNGSALWAIVVVLVAGVVWIENRFGPNIAGAAILALFGILAFIGGQLLSIAGRQVDGNQRIGELQATTRIELERIKGDNVQAKFDAQMQLKQFMMMMALAKKMMGQPAALPQAEPEQEDNTIDLDTIRAYKWNENDL